MAAVVYMAGPATKPIGLRESYDDVVGGLARADADGERAVNGTLTNGRRVLLYLQHIVAVEDLPA